MFTHLYPRQSVRRAQPTLEALEDRCVPSAGELDPTFGAGGRVLTTFTGGFAEAARVAVQPDGKIVVAGITARFGTSDSQDFALVRYNADGKIDTTFGNAGRVDTDFFGRDDLAKSLFLQPDGKIVVEGQALDPGGDRFVALARYNADGSLDSTFGQGGKVTASSVFSVWSAVLQDDGKVVVAAGPGLLRFNPDGSPDAGFNAGTGANAGTGIVSALALQPDGKILTLGGFHDIGVGTKGVIVWRVNPDGSLDESYGTLGRVQLDGMNLYSPPESAAVQADGRLVITLPQGQTDSKLLRLQSDGRPDPGFGSNGFSPTLPLFPTDVRLQTDGKILVVGQGLISTDKNKPRRFGFAVQRVNAGGSVDAGFGSQGDGLVGVDFGRSSDGGGGLALQPDGKIVGAGSSLSVAPAEQNPAVIVLARFLADGTAVHHYGEFNFSQSPYQVAPNAGILAVTVRRTNGSEGTVTVDYATADGTAKDNVNYRAAAGTLTFAPGEETKTITVPILQEDAAASDKTFTVTLSNPTGGAALGGFIPATSVTVTHLPAVPDGPPPSRLALAASAFAHSREHYQEFVTGAYANYLGRTPDGAGLAGWTDAMLRGLTQERLEANFLGSAEYIAGHGGSGRAWVVGMYQDLLGRTPSDAEVEGWVRRLATDLTPFQVAYGFAASREREGNRIQQDYATYLGRSASTTEVNAWLEYFLAGYTKEDLVTGFVGSLEYYQNAQKGQGNRAAWVAAAYRDVLFREPRAGEVNAWLTFLS